MGAATPNTTNFSFFPALAGELRNQIWDYALPHADNLTPALASFKPGCWRWRGAEPDLELEFRDDLLRIYIEVPLAYVNREARSVAVARIHELGLVAEARCDMYPVFFRVFSPAVDAIYVKPRQLDDMITDVERAMYEPWVEGRSWSNLSRYRKIAMSETSLVGERGIEEMVELIENVCSINEVLVVVDAPAGLESAGDYDSEARPLWRFVPAPGDVFCWSIGSQRFVICKGERVGAKYVSCRHRFDVRKDECVGDGVVSALVTSEKVTTAFTQLYAHAGSLQVRPVYAIRE